MFFWKSLLNNLSSKKLSQILIESLDPEFFLQIRNSRIIVESNSYTTAFFNAGTQRAQYASYGSMRNS